LLFIILVNKQHIVAIKLENIKIFMTLDL